jgi:FAD synthase
VQIYSTNGKLVKTFKKSSPITFQDWQLKNEAEVPVASGIYLIRVHIPDVGDKILKLFLGARQVDLQGL